MGCIMWGADISSCSSAFQHKLSVSKYGKLRNLKPAQLTPPGKEGHFYHLSRLKAILQVEASTVQHAALQQLALQAAALNICGCPGISTTSLTSLLKPCEGLLPLVLFWMVQYLQARTSVLLWYCSRLTSR